VPGNNFITLFFYLKNKRIQKIQSKAWPEILCDARGTASDPSTLDIEYRSVYPNVPFGAVCCG
jgi:hypothetical protein